MHRLAQRAALALAALAAAPSALAHFAAGAAPHWHAGDFAGLGAVVALTAGAAWLDLRLQRARGARRRAP